MGQLQSGKRLAISKANAQMVGAIAAASFITIFCLVASKAALGTNRYQAHVTTEKEKAKTQLEKNIKAYSDLKSSYTDFDSQETNSINGSRTGTGDSDGSNSKIILDALPSKYDFPALASSIEKTLNDLGVKVSGISGTDDQLNQQANTSSPSPQAVVIPFSFTISGVDYAGVQKTITKLQQSIRPLQIDTLNISGGAGNMTVNVTAHTYYQPAKSLTITKKVIK
jgi:hypothetical protein